MSGRSGKVRKEQNVKAMEHDAIEKEKGFWNPPGIRTQLQRRNFDMVFRDGIDSALDPSRIEIPPSARYPGTLMGRSPSNLRPRPLGRARSIDSLSSFQRVRSTTTSIIESNIEKSALRVALDSQSNQIRNTLSGMFTVRKKAKGSQFLSRNSSPDSRKHVTELAVFKPGSLRSQPTEPPNIPLPPIPASQLKRWIPGEKHAIPWDKNTFDKEMWKEDGDILIFLECENMSIKKPKGRPSYRLHEKVLRDSGSVVLVSLLDEYRRNRESMLLPLPQEAEYLHTPENYPQAEKDETLLKGIVSYICLPPEGCTTETDIAIYNWGTRNALSLLYKGSLIGTTAFETLKTLHQRLCDFYGESQIAITMIKNYGMETKFLDPCTDLTKSVAMLGFAELEEVHWKEGYLDGFVHCVGMYNYLHMVPEFQFVKPATKALLQRYSLEQQHQIQRVEQRLATFNFEDMWASVVADSSSSSAREAFLRAKDFFLGYYAKKYGTWPTKPNPGSKTWLCRTQVREMQADFDSLYDYFVDRTVMFHVQQTHLQQFVGPVLRIIRLDDNEFNPDADEIPMLAILSSLSRKDGYPPIPFPYPLLPKPIPVGGLQPKVPTPAAKQKRSFFKKKPKEEKQASKDEDTTTEKVLDPLKENEFRMAYAAATNLLVLKDQFKGSELVDAFVTFEQDDKIGEVDPHIVRRGRWILIYGVLQVLASISNDAPNLLWDGGDRVTYFLNPKLAGCPPWGTEDFVEADPKASHCYTVHEAWYGRQGTPVREIDFPGCGTLHQSNISSPPSVSGTSQDDGLWMNSASLTLTENSNSGYDYQQSPGNLLEAPSRKPPSPPVPLGTDMQQGDDSEPLTPIANGSRQNFQHSEADSRQDHRQDFSARLDVQPPPNGVTNQMRKSKWRVGPIPSFRRKPVEQQQPPLLVENYLNKPLPTPQPKGELMRQEIQHGQEMQQPQENQQRLEVQEPDPQNPVSYDDEEPAIPDDLAGYVPGTPPVKPIPLTVKYDRDGRPYPMSSRRKRLEVERADAEYERMLEEYEQREQQARDAYRQQQLRQHPLVEQEERIATPEWQRLGLETPEYAREHIISDYARSRTATPASHRQPPRNGTPLRQERPQPPEGRAYDPAQPTYQQQDEFTPERQERPQSPEQYPYDTTQPAYQRAPIFTPQLRTQAEYEGSSSYEVPQPAYVQQTRIMTPQRQQQPRYEENHSYEVPQPAYVQQPRISTPPRREPPPPPSVNPLINYTYLPPQRPFAHNHRVATPPRRQIGDVPAAFNSLTDLAPPPPLFSTPRAGTPPGFPHIHDSPATARRRQNFANTPRPSNSRLPRPASPLKYVDWDNPTDHEDHP